MKAFVLSKYGVQPELREIDVPVPGDHQLLVRVHAAGLNPVDHKARDGKIKLIYPYALPRPMGNELAGVVEARGPGVTRFADGDRVFARVDKRFMGAFAEHAIVHEDHAATAPSSIDLVTAAAVPLAGLTALQVLRDELEVKPGMRLLITGGAGGVGTFAIQIAKALGAHVTTTASPRGEELVRKLGADVVIDYTKQKLAELPRDQDAAFDTVGADSLTGAFATVKRGGLMVSIAGMPEPTTATKDLKRGFGLATLFWLASFTTRKAAAKNGLRYRYLFMHESGADLAELAAMIDAGTLKPIIDRVFPFAEASAAFSSLEQGRAKGKILLRMLE